MSTKVYVEGGGESKALRIRCQKGFHTLLDKAIPPGRKPSIIAKGTRRAAFDAFCTALAAQPGGSYVLLVDSEDPIAAGADVWSHVGVRDGDRWDRPDGCGDDDLQFMVTCMEAWLVADAESLRKFYGKGFRSGKLPRTVNLESVDRKRILAALQNATRDTSKGRYTKDDVSFAALAALDPHVVRSKMPYCDRLLRRCVAVGARARP